MIHESQVKAIVNKISGSFSLESDLCSRILFKNKTVEAFIYSEKDQVICGTKLLNGLFSFFIKDSSYIKTMLEDGSYAKKGTLVLQFEVGIENLLQLKHISLYFLSRMSSIVNLALNYKKAIKETGSILTECRNYTPFMKVLEKEALILAGIHPHKRFFKKTVSLEQEHLELNNDVTTLLNELSENLPPTTRIEVHASNLKIVKEASEFGVDLIVLKNLSLSEIKMAQRINQKRSYLEVTGPITLDEAKKLAHLNIDLISSDLILKESDISPFSFQLKKT